MQNIITDCEQQGPGCEKTRFIPLECALHATDAPGGAATDEFFGNALERASFPTRSSPSAHHAKSGRANPQHPQIWTYHGSVGPQVRLCRRHPVTSISLEHCVRKTAFRLCRRHPPDLDFKAMTAVTAFSGDATNCAMEVARSHPIAYWSTGGAASFRPPPSTAAGRRYSPQSR